MLPKLDPSKKYRNSCRDKTCMVTGATSGIGRETAYTMAELGAKVVIVGRSLDKCEETRQYIRSVSHVDPDILLCDLASIKDVQRAADEFIHRGEPLHILINNAGAVYQSRQETVDGVEATFGVNHLGPFQFTLRLLPLLKKQAHARIVNVASEAHKLGGAIDFDDVELKNKYGPMKAYGRSKLANIFFTQALAQKLRGSGVTVNAAHPGAVATNLGSNNNVVLAFILKYLMKVFFRSPQRGAETSIYLASSPEVEGLSGRYFADCKEKKLGIVAEDDEAAIKLWNMSEKMTGVAF